MSRTPWADRIARAGELAKKTESVAQVLHFYQALLREQASWRLSGELTGGLIAGHFPRLLEFVERSAPAELAAEARTIAAAGPDGWEAIVQGYRAGEGSPGSEFFARAFLEPWAEAVYGEPAGPASGTNTLCPCCGRKPVVSVSTATLPLKATDAGRSPRWKCMATLEVL